MATTQAYTSVTLIAGADLSSDQYKLVKVDSTTRQVILCSATTDRPLGVLLNAPTSGQGAEVAVSGIMKVQTDGSVAIGNLVGPDADGLAQGKGPVATDGAGSGAITWGYAAGVALETDTGANTYVEILIDKMAIITAIA